MVPDQPLGGPRRRFRDGYSPAAGIGTLEVANFAGLEEVLLVEFKPSSQLGRGSRPCYEKFTGLTRWGRMRSIT